MSSEGMYKVFVYGTLMKEGRNSHVLNNARLISAKAVTRDKSFFMLQFESVSNPGNYSPGVFRHGKTKIKGQGKVLGELYEVNADTMKELDRLEGLGKNYTREEITLEGGARAWIYIKLSDDQSLPYATHVDYNSQSQCYYWMG